MVKAVYEGKTIALSSRTVEVEGHHYFPPEGVHKQLLQASDQRTTAPDKGEAIFYNIIHNGNVINNTAWSYQEPTQDAQHIKGYIAFQAPVEIQQK